MVNRTSNHERAGQIPAFSARSDRATGYAIQQQIKAAVHRDLIQRLDLERLDENQGTRAGKQQVAAMVHQLLAEQETPLSFAERNGIAQEVLNEVFGLGPLEPLLNDVTVTEILVNTANAV